MTLFNTIKRQLVKTIDGNAKASQQTARALTGKGNITVKPTEAGQPPHTDAKSKIFIPAPALKGNPDDLRLLHGLLHETGHIQKQSQRRTLTKSHSAGIAESHGINDRQTHELNNIAEDIYIERRLAGEIPGYTRILAAAYKDGAKRHGKRYKDGHPEHPTTRTAGLQLLQRNAEISTGRKFDDIIPAGHPARLPDELVNRMTEKAREYHKTKDERAEFIDELLIELKKYGYKEHETPQNPEPQPGDGDGDPEKTDTPAGNGDGNGTPDPDGQGDSTKPGDGGEPQDSDENTAPRYSSEGIKEIEAEHINDPDSPILTDRQLREATARALKRIFNHTKAKTPEQTHEIDPDKLINLYNGRPHDIFKGTRTAGENRATLYLIIDKSRSMKSCIATDFLPGTNNTMYITMNSLIDRFLKDLKELYNETEPELDIKIIFYGIGIISYNGKKMIDIMEYNSPAAATGAGTKPLAAVKYAVNDGARSKAIVIFTDGVIDRNSKEKIDFITEGTTARGIKFELPDKYFKGYPSIKADYKAPMTPREYVIKKSETPGITSESFTECFINAIEDIIEELKARQGIQ